MRITPLHDLIPGMFPSDIYKTTIIAKAESESGERFDIVLGLDKELAAQLKRHSLDESDDIIQKNTSDHRRFGEGSYETWYAKNRTPFALVETTSGTLAAFAWFGPKPLGRKSAKHLSEEQLIQDESTLDSGNWHTISYRSYFPFRGKRLMKDFINFVTNVYRGQHPDIKLWAIINIENAGSFALASSLGYKVAEKGSDETSVVMIKD